MYYGGINFKSTSISPLSTEIIMKLSHQNLNKKSLSNLSSKPNPACMNHNLEQII